MADTAKGLAGISDAVGDAVNKLKALSSLVFTLKTAKEEIQPEDIQGIANYIDWVHDELVGTVDMEDGLRSIQEAA